MDKIFLPVPCPTDDSKTKDLLLCWLMNIDVKLNSQYNN